jgi:hypothetical protein
MCSQDHRIRLIKFLLIKFCLYFLKVLLDTRRAVSVSECHSHCEPHRRFEPSRGTGIKDMRSGLNHPPEIKARGTEYVSVNREEITHSYQDLSTKPNTYAPNTRRCQSRLDGEEVQFKGVG